MEAAVYDIIVNEINIKEEKTRLTNSISASSTVQEMNEIFRFVLVAEFLQHSARKPGRLFPPQFALLLTPQ